MSTDFNETPGAARYRKTETSALGLMWKNPIFKLVTIVVVVGGVALAGSQFMKRRNVAEETSLPVAQGNAPTTGQNAEITPEYLQAVQQQDQTRAETARGSGQSALPTPISTPVATPTVDTAVAAQEARDPLRDFESILNTQQQTQAQQGQQTQQRIEVEPETPAVSPEVMQSMTRAYRAQMDLLMNQWAPVSMQVVGGSSSDRDDATGVGMGTVAGSASGTTPVSASANAAAEHRPIVEAGSVYYGQMLMEANSDIPGPIMAQILTGPLAGGKAIGTFETYRNHLMLRFKTVAINGRQIGVDIIALDPDTTLGGVVTEVDPRYFTRVLMPAAAEFISAYGEAISEPSSTTSVTGTGSTSVTTNSQDKNGSRDAFYKGLGSAFDKVSEFVDEEAAATKRLVRVAVGTPVVLFFVSRVCDMGDTCTGTN